MRSNRTEVENDAPGKYTVWFAGQTHRGTAERLLESIRRKAGLKSEEIRKLTTETYASRIVADARAFLPKDLLAFLRKQQYPSNYDRALRYLSEMSASGVRILTAEYR